MEMSDGVERERDYNVVGQAVLMIPYIIWYGVGGECDTPQDEPWPAGHAY